MEPPEIPPVKDIALDSNDKNGGDCKTSDNDPIDPPVFHRNHSVTLFIYVHERGRKEILLSSQLSDFAEFIKSFQRFLLTPRMAVGR